MLDDISCHNRFSVAVIKYCDAKQLWKQFILAYGSSRVIVHYWEEAWQQAAGMLAGSGS